MSDKIPYVLPSFLLLSSQLNTSRSLSVSDNWLNADGTRQNSPRHTPEGGQKGLKAKAEASQWHEKRRGIWIAALRNDWKMANQGVIVQRCSAKPATEKRLKKNKTKRKSSIKAELPKNSHCALCYSMTGASYFFYRIAGAVILPLRESPSFLWKINSLNWLELQLVFFLLYTI